jgi:two-component system phosphate regulon sensor histidine kinase PhoR
MTLLTLSGFVRGAIVWGALSVVLLVALKLTGHIGLGAALLIGATQLIGIAWLTRSLLLHRTVPAEAEQQKTIPVPQEFLEQVPDPVIVLDAGREIVAVNRSAQQSFGIELPGRDLALSLRHPDVLAAVETVMDGLPSVTQEITLPAPVPRTFTLYAGVLHGAHSASKDPEAPHVMLVLRDETRAKRAEQSRADFVANASHELRSPLSALIGFIETLRGAASEDAAARDRFLGVMQTEAQRMTRLVEDLMSLTRVEINEHVPPRHRVDLGEVLTAVTEALTVRAEQRQMTLVLEAPADLPQVIGETDQLAQVFHNLVDNAVKYARAGTEIRISASRVERLPGTQTAGVKVSVADRGDGIPAIHLPRLTERFYRADQGRSRRLGGTGLGLAIVKHIVNRHRGRLNIDSVVGEGSTFTVFLPAAPR